MIDSFLTPWRLKWYPIWILSGITVGFIIGVSSGKGARIISGRLGGDFPAFYGAGRIVASGDFDQLYNIQRQVKEQKNFLPGESGLLPFAYPPYVALVYAPLSLLPYRLAFILHTFLMLGALILSLYLCKTINQGIRQYFLLYVTLVVSFYPFFKTVFNGQNTPLTLLLILLVWRLVLMNRHYLAGISLGLLLYKPQFALPLMGLYLLSGRWKVALSSSLIAIILFSIGAMFFGSSRYIEWIEFANWFSNIDAITNKNNAISWLGFSETIFGSDNLMALYVGGILMTGTIIGISRFWFVGGRNADITLQMALAIPCVLLISPHAMYYDIGLCLFTYIFIFNRPIKRKPEWIAGLWLLGFSQLLAGFLGFSPLFFLLVLTLILVTTRHGRSVIRAA